MKSALRALCSLGEGGTVAQVLSLLLTAYATVLIAELVGDKTLYTLGSLATRFRPGPILAGAALAFVVKMAVAVLFGQLIASLHPAVVSVLGAATFFSMAMALGLKRPKPAPAEPEPPRRWAQAGSPSFLLAQNETSRLNEALNPGR